MTMPNPTIPRPDPVKAGKAIREAAGHEKAGNLARAIDRLRAAGFVWVGNETEKLHVPKPN